MNIEAKRYGEAIADYQAAYSLAPLPELLFNIAEALRHNGDEKGALEYYRKYVAAAPKGRASDDARRQVSILSRRIERAGGTPAAETKPADVENKSGTGITNETTEGTARTSPPDGGATGVEQFVAVTLTTAPEGATVLLDGQVIGNAATRPLENVRIGTHLLEATLKGYLSYRKEIEVTADAHEFAVLLQPIPTTGRLRVASSQVGSSVSVDGRLRGATPVDIDLEPGHHAIEVSADGFVAKRNEVEILAGSEQPLDFDLQAIPPKAPVYKKWWLWTVVGAVVGVGVGVGLGIGLSSGSTTPMASTTIPAYRF